MAIKETGVSTRHLAQVVRLCVWEPKAKFERALNREGPQGPFLGLLTPLLNFDGHWIGLKAGCDLTRDHVDSWFLSLPLIYDWQP
jgi:hypothetical protein